ncbi:MAG: endopeptidase La [bacterium]
MNELKDDLEIQEVKNKALPLLPLRGVVVFPYMVVPLNVGREISIKALEEAMLGDRIVVLSSQKQENVAEPKPEDIFSVGTIAEAKQLLKLPDGTMRVVVEGLARAKIKSFIQEEPYYLVEAEEVTDNTKHTLEIEALMRNVISDFEQYIKLSKRIPPETLASVVTVEDPGRLADLIASYLMLRPSEKQAILESIEAEVRLQKLSAILAREMEILELEKKIHAAVRKQMEKTQKEYYLREQMKAIQKELGDQDEKEAEIEELRTKVKELELPEKIAAKAEKEIRKLERMGNHAAEAVVVRNYIDLLLTVPWTKETVDSADLKAAEKILNEDHYGLEKVKERILEFLAVRHLTNQIKGPILCLVGPPGVGKTSLGRSVARALNREFVRISLGGVRDEAEIRGHRRTYVGAMAGRIIQGMKEAGTVNPIFLLDEIDKMSTDFRGDPSAALLEVLDPAQNNTFSDHYLELPYDLSKVMFITTANGVQGIPAPLLDRMEVIYLSGYTEDEKVKIAEKYLVPKALSDHGLVKKNLSLGEKTLRRVISGYTREAGVRNLERNIASLCRKAGKEIVCSEVEKVKITPQNLHKFLGPQKFLDSLAEKRDEIGVATGLAWTSVGGDILPIEVALMPGKGSLILTGKLGDVMKESAQAAFSYVRSRSKKLGIDSDFLEKNEVHIHVPEGAIPKDGPSAGITMATALVSALTDNPVCREVAMTGEITLRGRVLPIGGLKEKLLAAHRSGIKKVLIPFENKKDLEDIPANVRDLLKIVPVENLDQVLEEALVNHVN